jgi:hypothetical protein
MREPKAMMTTRSTRFDGPNQSPSLYGNDGFEHDSGREACSSLCETRRFLVSPWNVTSAQERAVRPFFGCRLRPADLVAVALFRPWSDSSVLRCNDVGPPKIIALEEQRG